MGDRKLTILYGSQTGTAQEVAERIWRESKWLHFHGPIMAMDDYPIQDLIYESLVIFVCSTTGQGEEPDNMKRFWKFLLRKNLPADSLGGVRYAVLGLGDSSYTRFNYAAKKLNQRIAQLGGRMLQSPGLADDQHDLGADAAVDPWISTLWHRLADICPLSDDLKRGDKTALFPPRWSVTVKQISKESQERSVTDGLMEPEEANATGDLNQSRKLLTDESKNLTDSVQNSAFATVTSNTRTTTDTHFQDVRLIELSAPGVFYVPGDVLSVTPHNLDSSVESLLALLQANEVNPLTPDAVVRVAPLHPDIPVPPHLRRELTVRECAQRHWDLNAVPRRYLFQLLAAFTTSDLEREKFVEFTTPEGQEELFKYANRPRRTVLETLLDFPYAARRIPVEYLFEVFQPIRARAFSIASSPTAHRDRIHVLLAVVNYKTKLVKPRLGLCSNWLAGLKLGSRIPVAIRSGSFKFPTEFQKKPIIMIGPGTGVAPFRSYINERVATGTASKDELFLFFGCRNEAGDFHCRDEWKAMQANGQLTLFCAFSRDQEHKRYVQHVIAEESKLLWELLRNEDAHIFLAGSAKNMPTAVKEALIFDVAVKEGMSVDDATQLYKTMELDGRYQCETWS